MRIKIVCPRTHNYKQWAKFEPNRLQNLAASLEKPAEAEEGSFFLQKKLIDTMEVEDERKRDEMKRIIEKSIDM